jgi:hypothetical protein
MDNHLVDCTNSRVLGKYVVLDGGARDVVHKYLVGSDQEPGCSAMLGCSERDGALVEMEVRRTSAGRGKMVKAPCFIIDTCSAVPLNTNTVSSARGWVCRGTTPTSAKSSRTWETTSCVLRPWNSESVCFPAFDAGNMLHLPIWGSEMFLLCTRRTSQISL